MTDKTHLHVSLHLSDDVTVDVGVHDGRLSLHLVTVSLDNPYAVSFVDLHGDAKQMERIVAALEQGLMEVLRAHVDWGIKVAFPDHDGGNTVALP